MTVWRRLPGPGRFLATRSGATPPDAPAPGRFERIVLPAVVMTYALGMPIMGYGRVLAEPHRPIAAVAAAIATACSVPLQLWLLFPVARARRRPRSVWLVAAFTAINLAAFVFIGPLWFVAGEELAVLAAILLAPRWSIPAVTVLAAIPAAMAIAGHDPTWGTYYAQNTVFWAMIIGVLIWLARATAELRSHRRELAASAVISERARIDDELGTALGVELGKLVAAGEQAAELARDNPAAAERELHALTGTSRRALAETRRMVGRYRAITVRSELITAVALLTAAGIPSQVDIPPETLDQGLDNRPLAEFRSELTTLLRDNNVSACAIATDGAGDDVRLTIRGRQRETS